MQENNFEKQVQQKMEELSFTPSAPVWQKVEAQIKQKKERRRVVAWLLPLLLLTGSVVWWQYGVLNKEKTESTAATLSPNNNSFKSPYTNNPTAGTSTREENVTNSSGEPQTTTSATANIPGQNAVLNNESTQKPLQKDYVLLNKHKKSKGAVRIGQSTIAKVKTNKAPREVTRATAAHTIAAPTNTEESIFSGNDTTTAVAAIASEKEISALPSVVDSVPAASADSAVAVTPAPVATTNKLWQREVQARVGLSGVRTEMLNVFASQEAMDFSAAPAPTGSNAPNLQSSSKSSNGISFSVGAGLRRKAGKRSFVTAGLQYSYYSTVRQVGARVSGDTAVANNGNFSSFRTYYRSNASTQSYRTQLHYIELPIGFEYQLFQKLPLHLRHGISVGRLVHNNALTYDRQAAIYYPSDRWLRQTAVNLFTTVDYRLLEGSRLALYTGPQLQWGLTPLQTAEAQRKQHLFWAGLNTRLTF